MTDINLFQERLQTIKQNQWEKLFALLNNLEKTDDSEDSIDQFLRLIYDLGIILNFDWSEWGEAKHILDNKKQNYEDLDLITLCKLLTTIIRADRFSDGLLAYNLSNGMVFKVLQSIKHKVQAKS